MVRSIAVVVMVVSCASPAFARIGIAPTVEWLADTSDGIGVYEVTAVDISSTPQAHDPAKNQYGKWGAAKVAAVLRSTKKGAPPKELDTQYLLHPTDSGEDIRKEIAKGDQLVCFFRTAQQGDHPEMCRVTNLSSVPTHGPHALFFPDFTVARNGEAILKAMDARLALPRTGDGREREDRDYWVEVPFDKEAHGILYGGSACYLIVPIDLWPKATSK